MSKIQHVDDCPFCKQAIRSLKLIVGWRAFKALRLEFAVLQIWRRSSPHNWWVESAQTGRQLWHSSEKSPRPDLRLFELVEDSEETIVPYFGADSGKPERSIYKLKPEYANLLLNNEYR